MNDEQTIELSAGDVRYKDHLHWTFYSSAVWKCALIVPTLLGLFLLGFNLLAAPPVTGRLVLEILYPSFVVLIMIFVWTFLLISMQFRRLSPTQRSVAWVFSNAGVAVKDQAGNEIKKPWSEIKSVKYSGLGVRLEFRPFGSYWIPNRWFNEDQIIELQALTQRHKL